MPFNRHEDDLQKFLAGKVESLTTSRSGPRGKNRIGRHVEGLSESCHERRGREHEEAVIKFLAEIALAEEFVAEYGLPSLPTPEQSLTEHNDPSPARHEQEDSGPKSTGSSGEEVNSLSASEDAPSSPHYSPRKRNWHKRDIPSWSDDNQAVYDAIRIHLKLGENQQQEKKTERACLLYRAVLARWRSTYNEADLFISGLNEENVKKMLQRLKKDGDRFQRWLNDPSTAQHIVDMLEWYFFYRDRVRIFEDGSYAFVDEYGDLSGDPNVVFRPMQEDDDAEDERIMNILEAKGILPPKKYDLMALMQYGESVRLQKQAERDQSEQEAREVLGPFRARLAQDIEDMGLRIVEKLCNKVPPDLNAIFGVKPSNLSLQSLPRKDRSTK